MLRDLRALGCEVHVVARSAESVRRAREGGASSIVGSVEDLPALDGAVVASLTSSHAEVVRALLPREVPVFVEKPLTDDADDARELVDAAGERIFLMDKWRYHPGVRAIAGLVRRGEIGAVTTIHTRRISDSDPHPDVDTVWTHLPHDLAIADELLGFLPEPAWAVEERVDGARVGLHAGLGGPPWVITETSCVAPAPQRQLRVTGTDGAAWLDGGYAEVIGVVRDGVAERRPIAGELPLLAELRAFTGFLHGGPPPVATAAKGLEVVRAIASLSALAGAGAAVATAAAGAVAVAPRVSV